MPSSFQECEYIQSSGSQWINTLIVPNPNTVVDIQFMSLSNAGNILSGGQSWANGDLQISVSSSGKSEAGYYAPSQGSYFRYYKPLNTVITMHLERPVTSKSTCSAGIYSISGDNLTTLSTSYPMAIFCYYREGSTGEFSSSRLYYLQLYDSSTLVRDYVPCYCTTTVTGYKGSTAVSCASGTIGLFDLVNSRFYVNSGSGTFTKGGDV